MQNLTTKNMKQLIATITCTLCVIGFGGCADDNVTPWPEETSSPAATQGTSATNPTPIIHATQAAQPTAATQPAQPTQPTQPATTAQPTASTQSTQLTAATQATQLPQKQYTISYDLPKGWEQPYLTYEKKPDVTSAILNKASEAGIEGSKLDFSNPYPGTEEDAQNAVCPLNDSNGRTCKFSTQKLGIQTFETDTFKVGKYTVYADMTQGILGSDTAWQNNFSFVKDGMVYVAVIYGERLDYYVKELEIIINSIKAA
jgi:nucleoid-associated protein YgaU